MQTVHWMRPVFLVLSIFTSQLQTEPNIRLKPNVLIMHKLRVISYLFSWLQKGQLNMISKGSMALRLGPAERLDLRRPMMKH
jgi:hypothetical protein